MALSFPTRRKPVMLAGAVTGMVLIFPIFHLLTMGSTWGLLLGRKIRGICEGDSVPDIFIPALVALYKQGRFPFDKLVKFYPFEQINQAVQDSEQGRTIKAVLTFA